MNQIQYLSLMIWAILVILLLPQTASAQQTPPVIEWQRLLGGNTNDDATSIEQTSDGGYIVAGYSESTDGDVVGHHGAFDSTDYWVVKLTSTGLIEWQQSLGGSKNDCATSIKQTSDGGYIVAGYSNSIDGDVTGHHGLSDSTDYWIVKLTSTGVIEWQKSLGGSGNEQATSIAQTSDGGYIVAGWSCSTDGDVTGHHGLSGASDYWIVKLTSIGETEWQKSLGGSGSDEAESIQQTNDGGYIVAGYSNSTDGDVTEKHGNSDYWIVKLMSTGEIEWQKLYGGSSTDGAKSIRQTSDGGYIIAGLSTSKDGDVTSNHGGLDYWIVKLTSTGVIEWQKSLGGREWDQATSIEQVIDGGYIVAGWSWSGDGDVSGHHGSTNMADYWIVKLTNTGVLEWQKSLGGSRRDEATSIKQTTDGGYIVAGYSNSTDGDVMGYHSSSPFTNYWIIKLASPISDVNLQPRSAANLSAISAMPNPAKNTVVLRITSDVEAEYTIEFVSSIGVVVKRQNVHLGIGEQKVQFTDMGSLSAGSYEVIVSRGGRPLAHERVIVVGK